MTDPTNRQWATPYGVLVTATMMEVDGKPEPMIDAANTAIMLGIHDPAARARFVDEMKAMIANGGVAADGERDLAVIARRHGGHAKAVRLALPPPPAPLYPTLQAVLDPDRLDGLSMAGVVDSWAEALTDEDSWHGGAVVLLELLERQIEQYGGRGDRHAIGTNLSGIVTVVLEKLGETEVACLESASLYALTMHDHWRAAGREWLLPHRGTWVRDWIKDRPVYRRLARLAGMVHRDVPSWLKEVR